MNKLIWFGLLLAVVYLFVGAMIGITGLIPLIALSLAIALTVDYFGIFKIFPFKLNKKFSLILLLLLWGYTAFSAGWLTSLLSGFNLPTGGVIPVTPYTPGPQGTLDCAGSVSQSILGLAATPAVNAWDMESNTPYSAAVDFQTYCWIYKNGNNPTDFVTISADTAAATLSSMYSIGDTAYIYCGGTTYYGDPVEGLCINSASRPVNILAHTIVTQTNLQTTGYDSTGAATLSASADETSGDYYMTLGAGGTDILYNKLKVNQANSAYNFCGWAVALYYNISSVTPQNEAGAYTKMFTPVHLQGVVIVLNSTGGSTLTKDYVFYKINTPIMLHQWDSVKEQFEVKAHTTNDPIANYVVNKLNGFAILAKDCTWARGDDGVMHKDFYTHDITEADVGLAETATSPIGKASGMQVEVR